MQNTVKFVNQPYDKPGDLQNLLHYAMTDKRTGTWCEYTGGINTAPLYAIDEMMYVKRFFRKTEGRQLRHIIVSPDTQYYFRLAPQDLYFLALRIGTYLSLPSTPVKTDSYIAVQLLEQQKSLDIQSISEMAELVEGSFVFTVLDENNNLYFVKGDNPLALYHYDTCGLYVYASTEAILDRAEFPAQNRISTVRLRHFWDTALKNVISLRTSSPARIFSARATLL